MDIIGTIEALRAINPKATNAQVRAMLPKGEFTEELIEEHLPKGSRAGWTQQDTLAWLGEEPRTEKELFELIIEKEQQNEARWVRDRNRVRKLLNAVYAKFDQPVPEEAPGAKLKDAITELGKRTKK